MDLSAPAATKFDLNQIKTFWTDQANEHGTSHAASWSDKPVIALEIEHLAGFLDDGDCVLDIGCANGFSTTDLARRKNVQIQGVDYIPKMIEQANERVATLETDTRQRIDFAVGDITELNVPGEIYDKTIVVRVLINLGDWENQVRGLRQAARTVRPGGLLLLSEATVQGHQRLNEFRNEWGLPPIPEPPFNCYLDEEKLVTAAEDELDLVEVVNFASTYFVGTRVIKPLLAKLAGDEDRVPDPNMHWNRWLALLPPAGDYGTQKLFVFRKR